MLSKIIIVENLNYNTIGGFMLAKNSSSIICFCGFRTNTAYIENYFQAIVILLCHIKYATTTHHTTAHHTTLHHSDHTTPCHTMFHLLIVKLHLFIKVQVVFNETFSKINPWNVDCMELDFAEI